MDGQLLRFRKDVRYVIADLETYSLALSFQQNLPWQVGLLEVLGDQIVNSLDIRVNWPEYPHLKIGAEAARVTRYNQADQDRLGIPNKEAFATFWPILKRADRIIIHNGLNFDIYLLKDWATLMGEEWKWLIPKIIDTNAVARGIKLNIKYNPEKDNFLEWQYRMSSMVVKGCKTNLTALGKEFGITEINYDLLHSANEDVKLNWLVWKKLVYQIEL